MSSISKPDHCAESASLALLSAYQEYLMTFKLMTSQVVQRARPLKTCIYVLGGQRVNLLQSRRVGNKINMAHKSKDRCFFILNLVGIIQLTGHKSSPYGKKMT